MLLNIVQNALNKLIYIIVLLILARSILSWFPGAAVSRAGSLLVMLTEPILSPIRRIFMRFEFARTSPLDFTPLVAIILLFCLQSLIGILFYLFGA